MTDLITVGIFLVQFGTVTIYIVIFLTLRRKTKRVQRKIQQEQCTADPATFQAINRITKLMTLYPCVYILLTLPLSAGRMWSYAHNGQTYGSSYACFAGAMITSCGWVDSLLYTLTRRRLLNDTMPARSGRSNSDHDLGSEHFTYTRSVATRGSEDFAHRRSGISGGSEVMNSLSPRQHADGRVAQAYIKDHEPPISPIGSIDPIVDSPQPAVTNKTLL